MGYAIVAEEAKEMDGNVRFHRFRYHLARGFVTQFDTVADYGCGTGYGSEILADVAKKVWSFDFEKANIDACNLNHSQSNISFHCEDLEEFRLPKTDVSVMFEVLEHLYKPDEFVKKLEQNTSEYIIMSVPLGQELVWVEEDQEFQEKGDKTHKSVFATQEQVLGLFEDPWKLLWGFRDGVTFIFVMYNAEAIS